VLERLNGKLASTPLANHFHLSTSQCPKTVEEIEDMSKVPYATIVGCLMYAMVCFRPNLAHAVGVVSNYMENIGRQHYDVCQILHI
jgi:hypothetical protein